MSVWLRSIWTTDAFEIRKFTGSARLRESARALRDFRSSLAPEKGRPTYRGLTASKGFAGLKKMGSREQFAVFSLKIPMPAQLWSLKNRKEALRAGNQHCRKSANNIHTARKCLNRTKSPDCFFATLNVANRPELLHKWASLWAEGPETLEILASGAIADRPAIEVADWDERSRTAVLGVLKTLRCSASIQVEIVERIDEIAIRDEKVRAEIIESPGALQILASKELNHRRKTQALRDLLAELRFPRFSSRQKRFRREIESLGLPPRVRIIPPPAFEGSNWRIELSFAGPDELRKILDSAGALVESDRMETIFRPPGR